MYICPWGVMRCISSLRCHCRFCAVSLKAIKLLFPFILSLSDVSIVAGILQSREAGQWQETRSLLKDVHPRQDGLHIGMVHRH